MKTICTSFTSEEDKRALVSHEDDRFRRSVCDAVSRLIGEGNLRVLTVSGPSCSGKTTTAEFIREALEGDGKRVFIISLDDFFISRSELLRRAEKTGGELDFDSPDTLDLDALARVTDAAFAGERILVPTFDFKTGERGEVRDLGTPDDDDVYLFEGIQAVYPAVTALLGRHPFRSVFLSVFDDAGDGNVLFTREEIRFLRRLVRDSRFRSSPPEFTFRIWESVRQNEEKHILPFAAACDCRIDTYHAYGLPMLRNDAVALLFTVGEESPYYREARALIERLTPLPSISPSYLSDGSLFREFFG